MAAAQIAGSQHFNNVWTPLVGSVAFANRTRNINLHRDRIHLRNNAGIIIKREFADGLRIAEQGGRYFAPSGPCASLGLRNFAADCAAPNVFDRDQCRHRKIPIIYQLVAPGWGLSVMATAAHYRKLAEECFQWAHEARDMSVRQHYAKLCQIWLECAARAELRSGALTPPETTQNAA